MKRRYLIYMIGVLFLISCGNQNTDNKKQKLSPNELYKRKVDATCTIITDLGQGSGFFIDSNIIVTNYHVIANTKTANVVLNNEAQKYEILGYLAVDKINDVALLMVDYKSQKILKIENEIPNPGDHVFSISTPIGLSKTFSDGLISGKKNFDGRTLIQITVPISHGSSGCPIMNEYGDVVGIAVGGIEEGNNLNFCIPTSYLLNLLEFKESYPTALNTNQEGTSNEVTIGKQVWMTKNLNVDKFRNGDPIPEAKTNEEWAKAGENGQPAWCYYNNNPDNGDRYGKLYNWFAVNDPRGLAPEGWKIPSDEEWIKVTNNLGGQEESTGRKMQSTFGWKDNDNGTNESGFSGLPAGNRFDTGDFRDLGVEGSWWSSTEYGKEVAFLLTIRGWFSAPDIYSLDKTSGFSVRCLRD